MTSQRDNEDHLYFFNEPSGQIKDQKGTEDSEVATALNYTGKSVICDGVTSTIVLPLAAFTGTSDFSAYFAFKYLGSPSNNRVFWSMEDNGLSPNLSWDPPTKEYRFDVNNSGGTQVRLVDSELINNAETLVYSFSYLLSTRLSSFAVEGNKGTSFSGTATETGSVGSAKKIRLGVNGPLSVFTNIEYFQLGTYVNQFGLTDVIDTAKDVLSVLTATAQIRNRSALLRGRRI